MTLLFLVPASHELETLGSERSMRRCGGPSARRCTRQEEDFPSRALQHFDAPITSVFGFDELAPIFREHELRRIQDMRGSDYSHVFQPSWMENDALSVDGVSNASIESRSLSAYSRDQDHTRDMLIYHL